MFQRCQFEPLTADYGKPLAINTDITSCQYHGHRLGSPWAVFVSLNHATTREVGNHPVLHLWPCAAPSVYRYDSTRTRKRPGFAIAHSAIFVIGAQEGQDGDNASLYMCEVERGREWLLALGRVDAGKELASQHHASHLSYAYRTHTTPIFPLSTSHI